MAAGTAARAAVGTPQGTAVDIAPVAATAAGGIAYNTEYILRAVNTVFFPGAKTRDNTRNVWNAQNKQQGRHGHSTRQPVSRA